MEKPTIQQITELEADLVYLNEQYQQSKDLMLRVSKMKSSCEVEINRLKIKLNYELNP